MSDATDPDLRARFEAAKDASVLQVLFRTARRLNEASLARVREAAGHEGLRAAHLGLFPHIDLDGTRLTELAARVGVSKQAVGPLVDDLERMGILARVPDPDDGRAKRVVFASLHALMDGLEVLREVEAELAAVVGADRLAALHDTLRAVERALDAGVLDAADARGGPA